MRKPLGLLVGAVLSFGAVLAAAPAAHATLTPILDCVEVNDQGYLAHFGYENETNATIVKPVGGKAFGANGNLFTSAPIDRGQPTSLLPGVHPDVFQVQFQPNESKVTWVLAGRGATANADVAKRCVRLVITKQPPAVTTDTTAEIGWYAEVDGQPETRDWALWRDRECTLDGVPVNCDAPADKTYTNLAVGDHVWAVTAKAPLPACAALTPRPAGCLDNDRTVTGEVRWTIVASDTPPVTPPDTGPTIVAPASPAAAVPVASPTGAAIAGTAPKKTCTSRRVLTIRLRERKGQKIKSATVSFQGKRISSSRRTKDGRVTTKIDFRKLPSGRFSVQIKVKLTSGKTKSYTRKYYTCKPKLKPSNKLSSKTAL